MFYGLTAEGKKALKTATDTIGSLYPRMFHADHLITIDRCMGFLDDPNFMKAFRNNVSDPQEESMIWRLHTLVWAGEHCLNVPGDFLECGVYKAFSAAVMIDYLRFAEAEKTYYLYDTFEGKPKDECEHSPSTPEAHRLPELYEQVAARFSSFPNVKLVRGRVPDSFNIDCPEKIALLHIDMNSAKAEIGALEFCFDRMSPGGMIVFDDYGWQGYRAQKEAEDAFLWARGYSILELPTGQGLVVIR